MSLFSCAALPRSTPLGAADDVDPIQIEKKIRSVQKKLRRVQQIDEQVAHGLALDGGQQALLASKVQLQASLRHLLARWAVLEPALLELQEQRMLAIANSECAVCLDDYSPEQPAIRTSCCGVFACRTFPGPAALSFWQYVSESYGCAGYHFHKCCLEQCIESKSHCPICFTDKANCKIVEQRVAATRDDC